MAELGRDGISPAAPDILEHASEVGAKLKTLFHVGETKEPEISNCIGGFLSLLEMPQFGVPPISIDEFTRTFGPLIGLKESEDALRSLENARILRRVPGIPNELTASCRINHAHVSASRVLIEAFLCTDSPVADFRARVFPWADEGELLASYAFGLHLGLPPRRILDLCCGAGTAGILVGQLWPEAELVGVDNNDRAIRYARFNAPLNGLDKHHRYRFEVHDLINSGSLRERLGNEKFDLILVDPPFTSMPEGVGVYHHSNNYKVLEKALREALTLLSVEGTLILISYAFGSKTSPTQILELLRQVGVDKTRYEFQVSRVNEDLWRLNGTKCLPNPMGVAYMASRFFDPDYRKAFDVKEFSFRKYHDWIEENFAAKGLSHLHYVNVVIRPTKS